MLVNACVGVHLIGQFLARVRTWVSSDSQIKKIIVRLIWSLGLYSHALRVYMYLTRKANAFNPGANSVHLLNQYILPQQTWNDRFSTLNRFSENSQKLATSFALPSGKPLISVIVSLYRSDKFLNQFIQNMTGQTAFDHAEFHVVSVQPSEYERSLLEEWGNRFSNVTLDFRDSRVPIYVAWNDAIKGTSAPLITNANADDLRSPDSLALQIQISSQHPGVDVFYQDVFVSLEPKFTWSVIEAVNARTNFPAVSLGVLMAGQNYPHNAPAWRRSLHDQVGYFDEQYLSAADAEFWLRCALEDKLFMKMKEVHVAYYLNPEGISTSTDSTGASEFRSILDKYEVLRAKKVQSHKENYPLASKANTLSIVEVVKNIRNRAGGN